jgi:SAM-dependent methyltransferase
MSVVNTDQSEFWAELAPTWVELEQSLEQVSGVPGRTAMDRLGPRPGQHLLDLGCGAGGTTRELAARVTPGGSVVGVDIAAGMVEGARRRAAQEHLDNVAFEVADVEVHDLGEGRFDGAFSRFGIMFFQDPVAAFSNVRRSLRPGAPLVFACWQTVFDNEWMLVPGAAVMSVMGSLPMPGPDEPGPFSLADPARLDQVLGAAGFSAVDVQPHNDTVVLSGDGITAQVEMSMQIMATREALQETDDATREQVRAAIDAAFAERVDNGVLPLSRGFHVVHATT